MCTLKKDRKTSICFQAKTFNITVIQSYVPTTDTEEGEVDWVYEDLKDFLEVTSKKKKRFTFHHGALEHKSRKSRDIRNNRQI